MARRSRLVLMDMDGGVDDVMALALLLTIPAVEVAGVLVTPADCYLEPALSATRKLLALLNRSDIPLARSRVRGQNPFPALFRKDAFIVDLLPALNDADREGPPLAPEEGPAFLIRRLREASQPVTLLVTGPLTNLAQALDQDPGIEGLIEEVVWMGGALDVPGNVDPFMEPGHDGTAEWNAYWDPPAVQRVLASAVPFRMFPLDVTEKVPVTPDFLRQLARQRRYPLSDLAAQAYAAVAWSGYCLWDVTTTAWLARPELFTFQEAEVGVHVEGRSQGRTVRQPGGRRVQVAIDVQVEALYRFLLSAWAR
ncbi:nucleoside hydrolase [Thermoflexus sp.]|uniref:nucleoside hydrolase n=1 Tax=Thermoflexus sp. TaxID=1969742 RepID=UPI0025DD0EF7|nr:nucleoside hydrolase [Thermoflexus sp.]MCS7352014.1 nucleoside hydrolase [Thermoflexus sp.]MCX7691604.1 nucleoside hydrolase [Thermoflexus sp.]MDW8181473.1 nucleoside hydrolase [Anaerolineae bacterium]